MANKKYTPMIEQYLEIKERYPDTLILFRLGDFYELFFEDAKIASPILDLVLTGKDAGSEERVPMCGVPFHAVESYIEKLVSQDYKVGIVEQLEAAAPNKPLVKRDVVQIFTPGMLIGQGLVDKDYNYLVAINDYNTFYTIAYCDISTGDLAVLNVEHNLETLITELELLNTKEILISDNFNSKDLKLLTNHRKFMISKAKNESLTLNIAPLVLEIKDQHQIDTIIFLVNYLEQNQKRSLDYIKQAKIIYSNQFLRMDYFTRTNLELVRTMRNENKYGSLLWTIDKTKTAMGARLLKQILIRPLIIKEEIIKRQNHVAALIENYLPREKIFKILGEVYDLPRLISRIGYGNANGRDLVQLQKSLKVIPVIKDLLTNTNSLDLKVMANTLNDLATIEKLIFNAINDNPPLTTKEGGLIKPGFNHELDEIRSISISGKQWIANFEKTERQRTGIKNLKVGYNKVFGFYIEITNSYKDLVKPEFNYIRKQTLTNGERYITPELKIYEDQVLNAEDKMIRLEHDLFLKIRNEVKTQTAIIQMNADIIAMLDVYISFAAVSVDNKYVRPIFVDSEVTIKSSRHPIIEKLFKNKEFVANDININITEHLQIITGPNMGGKSTYMRQFALIVILAQIGCYVPSTSAHLKIFDAIYTRIGASDDALLGQSTFMVEMTEVNYALTHASKDSLIILDEIGRGTSTFDGIALAQAIIEHLTLNLKAYTLFSTHYHELTHLSHHLKGIKNLSTAVIEDKDNITFLYKIIEGPANKSYGINVAKLAKLPNSLIERASEILKGFESKDQVVNGIQYVVKEIKVESKIENEVAQIDPATMTPIEALNFLYRLKKK
jgi:DNA mismatch repair protein MutS